MIREVTPVTAPEAVSNEVRCRRCGAFHLVAESEVVPRAGSINECVHEPLQVRRKPPGKEIFEPFDEHAGVGSKSRAFVSWTSREPCSGAPIIGVVTVPRFFAPALDRGDVEVALPRDEAEHLTRVLRLGSGDTVAVFDGRGHEYLARVLAASRRDVRVQVMTRVDTPPEPGVAITLAQAVLKGDKMDEVVRDAVMLGVAAVQPIVSRHVEATAAAIVRGARLERWRRVALASVKQSRRAVLPEVRTPLTLESYLADPAPALTLMLVEPGAGVEVSPLGALRKRPVPQDAAVLVGPEGGWTKEECALAHDRGALLMTLGHRTLRADAVPVAALSVLQFLWDEL